MTSPSPSKTSEQRRTTPASRLMDGWHHAVERIRETGIGVPLAVLAVIAVFWVALRLANYAQQNAISPVEALVRIYGTGAAVLLTLVIAAASVWTIIERLGHTDKFFGPSPRGAARTPTGRSRSSWKPPARRPFRNPAARRLPPARSSAPGDASPLAVPEHAVGAGGINNDGGVPAVAAPATPPPSPGGTHRPVRTSRRPPRPAPRQHRPVRQRSRPRPKKLLHPASPRRPGNRPRATFSPRARAPSPSRASPGDEAPEALCRSAPLRARALPSVKAGPFFAALAGSFGCVALGAPVTPPGRVGRPPLPSGPGRRSPARTRRSRSARLP